VLAVAVEHGDHSAARGQSTAASRTNAARPTGDGSDAERLSNSYT
jgi:hypothetical protein